MSGMVTPCIEVCLIDEAAGICIGCGRTRAEIAQWTRFTPETRAAVMAELPARLNAWRTSRAQR